MSETCAHCALLAAPCFVHDTTVLDHFELREHCKCGKSRGEHGPSDPFMVYSDYLGPCVYKDISWCAGFEAMERGGKRSTGDAAKRVIDNVPGQLPAAPLCHRCGNSIPHAAHVDCITPAQAREEARGDGFEQRDMPGLIKHY